MSAGKKNIQDFFKVKPSEERARQSEHDEGTDGLWWFSNWKNALAKFREHEGSNSHKESAMKLAAKKCVGIDAQLSSQLRNEQAHHRTMLMRLLESIQFLVHQGLPLRGHKEDLADLEGNLYQLLLL